MTLFWVMTIRNIPLFVCQNRSFLVGKICVDNKFNIQVWKKCSVCTCKRRTTNCRHICSDCIVYQSLCKLANICRNKWSKLVLAKLCIVCVRKEMHSSLKLNLKYFVLNNNIIQCKLYLLYERLTWIPVHIVQSLLNRIL